jgi:hypothetical protein
MIIQAEKTISQPYFGEFFLENCARNAYNSTIEKDRKQISIYRATASLRCHCEPVRTLVWQSQKPTVSQ